MIVANVVPRPRYVRYTLWTPLKHLDILLAFCVNCEALTRPPSL